MMGSSIADGGASGEQEEEAFAVVQAALTLKSISMSPAAVESDCRPRRRMLLVLDLNGLLLESFSMRKEFEGAEGASRAVKVGRKWIIVRPGVAELLDFCLSRFDVGVWSCARAENVENYVECIFPRGWREEVEFVWGQDKCTHTGRKVPGHPEKPLFLKELKYLWQEFPCYTMKNTLMLDDTPYKSLRNPPYTAVFPEPYSALRQGEKDDFLMRVVVPWLDKLLVSSHTVQSFVMLHPLGQPPVSPSDPDWMLYRELAADRTQEEVEIPAPRTPYVPPHRRNPAQVWPVREQTPVPGWAGLEPLVLAAQEQLQFQQQQHQQHQLQRQMQYEDWRQHGVLHGVHLPWFAPPEPPVFLLPPGYGPGWAGPAAAARAVGWMPEPRLAGLPPPEQLQVHPAHWYPPPMVPLPWVPPPIEHRRWGVPEHGGARPGSDAFLQEQGGRVPFLDGSGYGPVRGRLEEVGDKEEGHHRSHPYSSHRR